MRCSNHDSEYCDEESNSLRLDLRRIGERRVRDRDREGSRGPAHARGAAAAAARDRADAPTRTLHTGAGGRVAARLPAEPAAEADTQPRAAACGTKARDSGG